MKKVLVIIAIVAIIGIGLIVKSLSANVHDVTTVTSMGVMKDADTGRVVGAWDETYTLD